MSSGLRETTRIGYVRIGSCGLPRYASGAQGPSQFQDLYQERVRKIIDAEVSNGIPMNTAPKTRTSGAPDLMEQIRLSLAELESKKPGPPKKQVRKTPTPVKKKLQRVRA